MRIGYIAGRYRHKNREGIIHEPRQRMELADETRWAAILYDMGWFPICPLHNSVHVERVRSTIPPEAYIRGDLAMLARLLPEEAAVFFRPGWRPLGLTDFRPMWYPDGEMEGSVGAAEEYLKATERGLVIVEAKIVRPGEFMDWEIEALVAEQAA